MLLHHNYSWKAGTDELVLVKCIADAKIGRRQSRFAPPSQLQLESWERRVSAEKMHCRCKDWEGAKQICSSITITAGKLGQIS